MGVWVSVGVRSGSHPHTHTPIHPHTHTSPTMPPIVGISANPARPAALECAGELASRLAARGVEVRLQHALARRIGAPAADDDELGRGNLLVAVGGDGTLLAASRLAAPHGTPILGVHCGGPASFGFMTDTSPAI